MEFDKLDLHGLFTMTKLIAFLQTEKLSDAGDIFLPKLQLY